GPAGPLVVDSREARDSCLSGAAISLEAGAADRAAFGPRLHAGRRQAGQMAVAERMRGLLDGLQGRTREPPAGAMQKPCPFRALPQVDGVVHDALDALEETVVHELNFPGENPLIVADEELALPNGNPHAAPLANA